MSNNNSRKNIATNDPKYCQHCGQKNFRPHRSVKELVFEFVENWFGYDSKAFKTARALCRPAALTLDYFRNSHHHNHYVTPIRLYIFLSIIFFLLTSFGGLNVTSIDLKIQPANKIEREINQVVDATPLLDEGSKSELKLDNEKPTNEDSNGGTLSPEQNDATTYNGEILTGCKSSEETVVLWPQWLDDYYDAKIDAFCDSYNDISYLPQYKQPHAKAQFGLTLIQNAIESLPQAFLFTLPLLALVLKLLYIRKSHLYVKHLVLLIHSHSFLFAAILAYLGWHQLEETFEWLEYIPVQWALLIWAIVYLYLSMKRLYKQGHAWTVIKFLVFAIVYTIVLSLIIILSLMKAVISV